MSVNEASQQANRAGMDPKRLVVIAYIVFGLIIALFLGRMLEIIAASLQINALSAHPIEGLEWKWSDVLGIVLTAAGGGYAWVNPRTRGLSMDVANELMRVTWPSWEETRVSTIAVVVASLVASIILFGMDTFSYKLMVDWLPKLLKGHS